MNAKNILCICSASIILSTVGCGNKTAEVSAQSDSNIAIEQVSTTTYTYTPGSIDRNSALSVAEGFIEAIKNNDFATVIDLINLDDGQLLTETDVEYVIRRTIIGYLIGQKDVTIYRPSLYEAAGTASYKFSTTETYDYQREFTMKLQINENNQWSIDKSLFVKSETQLYVPEGVRFYIDGEEVPSRYKVKTQNHLDIYQLPELARKEHNTTIVSSVFGEISGSVTVPSYDINNDKTYKLGDPIEIYRQITPELFNELGLRVKNIYNEIYILMDSEASAENLNQYITTDKNYKFLEEDYQAGISARLRNSEEGHAYTNTEILEFWQNPSYVSYVYSNDTIVINMVLSVRWNEGDKVRSEMICSGTKLTKQPGGEWMLNDITPGAWRVLQSGLDESQGVNAW